MPKVYINSETYKHLNNIKTVEACPTLGDLVNDLIRLYEFCIKHDIKLEEGESQEMPC